MESYLRHPRHSPLPFRRALAALLVGLILALSGDVVRAHGNHQTGLSGHELHPGKRDGEVTRDVLFSGTDNAPCNCWTATDSGGRWVLLADRTGHAGLGSMVNVVGGRWFWQQAGEIVHFGKVLGGTVNWPPDLAGDLGCGPGVARFALTLSVNDQATTGSLTGCLDDTHLPFVFPPKAWGTLSL